MDESTLDMDIEKYKRMKEFVSAWKPKSHVLDEIKEIVIKKVCEEKLDELYDQQIEADFKFHSNRIYHLNLNLKALRNTKIIGKWTYKRALKKLRIEALKHRIKFAF